MIYLDWASTTPVHPEVLATYTEYLKTYFANPDALYGCAVEMSKMMETSRKATASLLGVDPKEVFFTSGASESNNMAIKGIAFSDPNKRHLITTKIEHASVLHAFQQLEKVFGFSVTFLDVNAEGKVTLEQVQQALRPDTALVSIMMVNNEVGSIQPIEAIGSYLKKQSGCYFHVDATQALGKLSLPLEVIDCCSVSAHKIRGLKGSGLLIKKRHVPLVPLICGGQQEQGLRGGTSNALVDALFAKTLRLALEDEKENGASLQALSAYARQQLSTIPGLTLNSPLDGIATILNFSLPHVTSEVMMNALDAQGICVSAKSTCSSQEKEGSYVLQAMGVSKFAQDRVLRLSFSTSTTTKEIDAAVACIRESEEHYGRV